MRFSLQLFNQLNGCNLSKRITYFLLLSSQIHFSNHLLRVCWLSTKLFSIHMGVKLMKICVTTIKEFKINNEQSSYVSLWCWFRLLYLSAMTKTFKICYWWLQLCELRSNLKKCSSRFAKRMIHFLLKCMENNPISMFYDVK